MEQLFNNLVVMDNLNQYLTVRDLKNIRLAFPIYSSQFIRYLVEKAPMNINRYSAWSSYISVNPEFFGSVSVVGEWHFLCWENVKALIQRKSEHITKITFEECLYSLQTPITYILSTFQFPSLTKVVINIAYGQSFPIAQDNRESFPNLTELVIVDKREFENENVLEQFESFLKNIFSKSSALQQLNLGINKSVNLSRFSVKILTICIDGKKSDFSTRKINDMIRSATNLKELTLTGDGKKEFDGLDMIDIPTLKTLKSLALKVWPNPQAFNIGFSESIPFPSLQSLELTSSDLQNLRKSIKWPSVSTVKIFGINLTLLTNLRELSCNVRSTNIRVYCRQGNENEATNTSLKTALIYLSDNGFISYSAISNNAFEIHNLIAGKRVIFQTTPWKWTSENTHQMDFFMLMKNFYSE